MSFKKTKITSHDSSPSSSRLLDLRSAYELAKKRNIISAIVLTFFTVFLLSFGAMMSLEKIGNFQFDFSFLGKLNPVTMITGETQPEKINFLLAGIGGGVHDGPQLTDTIMLASINTRLKTVSLLSIPRDLYVEYPDGGAGRINELYGRGIKAYGQARGIKMLQDKISEITGEAIDHFLVVDFAGFTKFVDLLDGLEVTVPEDLVDTEYPNEADWTYVTFSIKKGLQTLDGDTALKYVRSRHSTSDFDRSLRQQLVMKAIKEKLLKLDYITNPKKLSSIFSTLSEHIKTDLTLKDMLSLALIAKDLPSEHILSFNINDSCFQSVATCQQGGLLYTPQRALFGGAAVLLPDGATANDVSVYTDIQKYTNIVINYPEVFLEKYKIHIVNATRISGLANKYALLLKKYGLDVPEMRSVWSTKDPYPKSAVFYRYDPVTKTGIAADSKTLEVLSLFIFADAQPAPLPKYSKEPGTDIEVVIGDDYRLFLK